MAASTASMCLRKESLSVHSHSISQDSSRFTGPPKIPLQAAIVTSTVAGSKRARLPLLALVGEVYDAAAGVRLLHGAGRVAGDQDDLQATPARVLFLDAARELLSLRVEGVVLGDPATEDALFAPDGADAGEGGLGVPFEAEHDARRVGFGAEGGFGQRSTLRRLRPGGGGQGAFLGVFGLPGGPLAVFFAGAGSSQQKSDEQRGHEGSRSSTLAGIPHLTYSIQRNPRFLCSCGEGSLPHGQLSRPQEHGVEHPGREDAGEGVLLGGMVATEEDRGAGCYLGAVGESGFGLEPEESQRRVPGEGAEADHDPGVEQLQLAGCIGKAGVALCGGGPVLRRGAANGGQDPGATEPEPVFTVARDGPIRHTCAVERGEEEVTRAVAGEDATGPVAAVGGGGETEDDDFCFRVSEAGDGAAPVVLVRVGGSLLAGHLLAPLDEPRATPAGDNFALERSEFLAA